MRRVLLPALLMFPVLLVIPQTASAKPPKVRLTIAGGSLTKAIEITDAQILERTYTRLPGQKPPAGRWGTTTQMRESKFSV